MRDPVLIARDYFVAVDGLTTNNGLSPQSPWPIQFAIDHVCNNLDIQNARVTIRCAVPPAGGCYPPVTLRAWVGNCNVSSAAPVDGEPSADYSGPCLIGGTYETMSSYFIGSRTDPAVKFAILSINNPTPWFVSGFTPILQNAQGLTWGQGILADSGSWLYLGNNFFGCTLSAVESINSSFIEPIRGFTTAFFGDKMQRLFTAKYNSQIIAQPGFPGSVADAKIEALYPQSASFWPTFQHCFMHATDGGNVNLELAGYAGYCWGPRKIIADNGIAKMKAGEFSYLTGAY